jgi:hypothetical protein
MDFSNLKQLCHIFLAERYRRKDEHANIFEEGSEHWKYWFEISFITDEMCEEFGEEEGKRDHVGRIPSVFDILHYINSVHLYKQEEHRCPFDVANIKNGRDLFRWFMWAYSQFELEKIMVAVIKPDPKTTHDLSLPVMVVVILPLLYSVYIHAHNLLRHL